MEIMFLLNQANPTYKQLPIPPYQVLTTLPPLNISSQAGHAYIQTTSSLVNYFSPIPLFDNQTSSYLHQFASYPTYSSNYFHPFPPISPLPSPQVSFETQLFPSASHHVTSNVHNLSTP